MSIKAEFDHIMEEFGPKFLSYNWENKDFYAGWLFQTYSFVNHSTRLLALGAGCAKLSERDLHKRFISHIAEESGHEVLAEQDIKRLGYKMSDFSELPQTRLFYTHQYWNVQNHGPSALMGWILFLEGVACLYGRQVMEKVKPFGSKCTNFLRVHAEEDQGHIDSAFKAIEEINRPEDTIHLIQNMQTSYWCYDAILTGLAEGKVHSKAA